MRALKALVIIMAILIAAGIAVLVVMAVERGRQVMAPGAEPAPATAPRAFGERNVEIPEGARVLGLTAEGERLVLRLGLVGGGERLLVIDMGSGETLGTLTLGQPP